MVCLHRGWDPATLVLNHRLEPSGATGDLGGLCWGSPPSALLQVLPPSCLSWGEARAPPLAPPRKTEQAVNPPPRRCPPPGEAVTG